MRGTPAGGVERNVRVEQEWHVVSGDIQVTTIDLGDVGQGIKVLNLGAVRGMHDRAILQERDAEDFFQRLALREFADRVVEFLAHHEIDFTTILQRPFGQHADMRSDESDLNLRIGFLDLFYQANVAGEARSAGEQHQELVVARRC